MRVVVLVAWALTLPLMAAGPSIQSWGIPLPGRATPPNVEVHSDIPYSDPYSDNDARDRAKHELDLYLPRGKTNFPVLLFVHGGGWRIGDRALYQGLGNRLAHSGIGVVIPSFRLMGIAANAHPAQIEDVAAAFAWTSKNIASYGGDPKRLYVSGHSSGGHLVSLLALDRQYLARQGVDVSTIRGVISISGVYNVDRMLTFHTAGKRHDASPLHHVQPGAPKFLLVYCQFDYLGFTAQARTFAAALKKADVPVEMVRIPRDNHISEIMHITNDDGPLVDAVLRFIQ